MRKCSKCQEAKPETEFYDGVARCKVCVRLEAREYRKRYVNTPKKNIKSKTCAKCRDKKSVKYFHKCRTAIDGYYSYCKECSKPIGKESTRKTRQKTSQKNLLRGRIEGEKKCYGCKKILPTTEFALHRSKPDGLSGFCKSCKNEYRREHRNRIKHTEKYKITNRIRSRFHQMLKQHNIKKTQPISKYGIDIGAIAESLGASPGEEYHIDHIFPICAFDLTNHLHLQICFHPSNLRWFHKDDNMRKHDSYDKAEFEKYLNTMMSKLAV